MRPTPLDAGLYSKVFIKAKSSDNRVTIGTSLGALWDSNPWHSEPQSDALTNWTKGTIFVWDCKYTHNFYNCNTVLWKMVPICILKIHVWKRWAIRNGNIQVLIYNDLHLRRCAFLTTFIGVTHWYSMLAKCHSFSIWWISGLLFDKCVTKYY